MRHVAQEAIALLRQLQQAHAQPFKLPAEILEIGRTSHGDRLRERALAELADGAIDLPDRSHQHVREQAHEQGGQQDQARGQPEEIPLCFGRLCLQLRQAGFDLFAGRIGEGEGAFPHRRNGVHGVAQ